MTNKKKNSNINYSGEVTVKILHGKKTVKTRKVHNNGTALLFNFLTRCLASQYEALFAPRYLRTFNVDNVAELEDFSNIDFNNDMISDALPFATVDVADNHVDFQFLIPNNLLKNSTTSINLLGLYSQDRFVTNSDNVKNPMAFVKLIDDDEISVASGENILIVWRLTLSNVENDTQSN